MTATTASIEPLAERVRAAFEADRSRMTPLIARDLGVTEAEVMRHLPDGIARELDAAHWESVLRALEPLGKLHVLVSSGAATLEANGAFGGFSFWGEYFNVQSGSLDLHIRYDRIGSIFAVRKPSHLDGVETLSFQFFDVDGASVLKAFLGFGGKPVPPERTAAFEEICAAYGAPASRGA